MAIFANNKRFNPFNGVYYYGYFRRKQSQIVKLAADFNFYGKRLRATKLEVCDDISKMVYDTTKHSTAICDWLEANKPAKPKAAKVAKAIKTMSAQKRRGCF